MAFWTDRLHPPVRLPAPDLRPLIAWAAAILLLAIPLLFQAPATGPGAKIVDVVIDDGAGGWRAADLSALRPPPGRVSTLRLRLHLDPAGARAEPLGLYLSGTFSAEAAWNGVVIGAKGRPGHSRAEEDPGLVDTVLPIPAGLVRPGDNELILRVSASHLRHRVQTVIHGRGDLFGLRVAPYSADVRRPVGHYAAPVLMSGVLVLALAALALRGQARSSGGLILAGLIVAALAEVSRSVVNYPWSLHQFRMLAITLAATLVGAALIVHAAESAGLARGSRSRWVILLLAAGCMAVAIAPQDNQMLGLCAGAAAVLAGWGAIRRRAGALELCAALSLMTLLALAGVDDFMDRGLYAAAAPLVAYLVWPRSASAPEPPEPASGTVAPPDRLALGPPEARRFVAARDILTIQGAGDYAELQLRTGERLLHLETLHALAQRLPARFFRVHRSHIVNLDAVEALSAQGGGRYRLRLNGGTLVPVSRSQVAELRRRLGG